MEDPKIAQEIDATFVARFAAALERDQLYLSNPRYRLLHDNGCPMKGGGDRCSCDPRIFDFRRLMLAILHRLTLSELADSVALEVLGRQTEAQTLRTCGVSLSSVKRWRRLER